MVTANAWTPSNSDQLGETIEAVLSAAEAATVEDLGFLPALPPADGWALGPDALALLVSVIRRLRPTHVLEFGSGMSTKVVAAVTRQLQPPCLITSVDHDPIFAAQAMNAVDPLDRHRVRLQDAPIVLRDCGGELLPTYLTDLPSDRPADIVLIDGPPDLLGGRRGVLFQALEATRRGTVVLIDDANRPAERAAIDWWLSTLGPAIRLVPPEGYVKGMVIIVIEQPIAGTQLWNHRVSTLAAAIQGSRRDDRQYAVVDDGALPLDDPRVTRVPLADNGWPAASEDLVAQIDDARALGCDHLVIAWPAHWCVEQYSGLREYLEHKCVLHERTPTFSTYCLTASGCSSPPLD